MLRDSERNDGIKQRNTGFSFLRAIPFTGILFHLLCENDGALSIDHAGGVNNRRFEVDQRPWNFGFRFSRKALMPSCLSWVP